MILKLIPRALLVCCASATFSVAALAQTSDIRPRQVKLIAQLANTTGNADDDPVIISMADIGSAIPSEDLKSAHSLLSGRTFGLTRIQPLLSAAIDQRLGSPYHWGSTGPNTFDCSGFVWSVFHSAGIDFERGSARTLWARFEAPAQDEKFKFGTLVFFSNLAHIGIVADEHGFYHASRHHGVVYSPFNNYWLSRIYGFRRVPVTAAGPVAVPVPVPQQQTDR